MSEMAQTADHLIVIRRGQDPSRQVALDNRVLIYELTQHQSSLEDAYFDLTKDEVEHQSHLTGGTADGITVLDGLFS